MDNEPDSALINGDHTDTNSQTGKKADNASRHTSRNGSAHSDRSKAASGREATNIDENAHRKPSSIAAHSPKPDAVANGDRQVSGAVKAKPPSPKAPAPIVPAIDTMNGDFNDDTINQEDEFVKSELEAIVRHSTRCAIELSHLLYL